MSSALARRRAQAQPAPSFAARQLWSGVHRLAETPMLINGAAPDPALCYIGNAAAGGWPALFGEALELQSGTAPTYNQGQPLCDSNVAVKFNDGGYFLSATAFLQPGLDDIVFEYVGDIANAIDVIAGTRIGGSGIRFYSYPPNFNFLIDDGAGNSCNFNSSIWSGYVHCLAFVDRNRNGILYVNKNEGSQVSCSGVGSVSNSNRFAIGSAPDGSNPASNRILYLALWHAASWLDTELQQGLVNSRFAILASSAPMISFGGTNFSKSSGSTSSSYLRKETSGVMELFIVGAKWPRMERVLDADAREFVGSCVEAGATNDCLQSCSIGTTWTVTDAAVASNSTTAPDATTTADTLTASADGGYLVQAFASITAVQRTYSHWIKRNGASNVSGKLQIIKTSDASTIAEVAFTATSSWQLFQIAGTCVLNDTEIRCLLNTNGESICVWGAQFEAGAVATSQIVTTTAGVARAADSFYYGITEGSDISSGKGSMRFRFLAPSFTPARSHYLMQLNHGGAANGISVYIDTSGRINASIGADGACQISGSVCDNATRECLLSWRTNDARLWCMKESTGAIGTAVDASVTVPTGLDRLVIGSDETPANHAGPILVADWKLYPRYQSSFARRGSGFSA
jgi:hypothetical protein